MDINNLKTFVKVATMKSFSRSAESLQITQPAVSKRIAALEADLSSKLFDRVGHSIELTEAGKILLPAARQITSELLRLEDVISNLDNDVSGVLNIGTTDHIANHRLPTLLESYKKAFPFVDLNLHFACSDELIHEVENGIVEIALYAGVGVSKYKLRERQVWRNDLQVVVASDHPLAARNPVSIDSLAEFHAVLPVKPMTIRKSIDNALWQQGVRPIIALETTNFDTIRSMVSIGLGWACIPDYHLNDTLTVLDIEELQLKYTISLIRHQERSLSRAAQAFWNYLPAAAS